MRYSKADGRKFDAFASQVLSVLFPFLVIFTVIMMLAAGPIVWAMTGGFPDGGPEKFWTGLSHFLPGGGAGPDATPREKVYVVLSGSLTVITPEGEVVLQALDSCCIPASVMREVKNRGNEVATMLVVMPYPEQHA